MVFIDAASITFLILIMSRKHGLREGLMLSFFLSNLSFSIVEGLFSRSSETVCRRAACHGLSAEMASMVANTT